ncbi:hypothetical protein SAMN05216299_1171 [Nitrosospira sp. Nsp14]|nr:hypothetical protein SAMN05216299_1171 [Nitrosospira sp. Nsp14]
MGESNTGKHRCLNSCFGAITSVASFQYFFQGKNLTRVRLAIYKKSLKRPYLKLMDSRLSHLSGNLGVSDAFYYLTILMILSYQVNIFPRP